MATNGGQGGFAPWWERPLHPRRTHRSFRFEELVLDQCTQVGWANPGLGKFPLELLSFRVMKTAVT